MADYIVTSGELTTVANAIRAKNGTSSNLSWPDGFVSGISSGSGGGGGESDFSTAEVTITWNDSKLGELLWDSCPTIVSDSMITGVMYTNISPAIITVPLYKGKCYWEKTTRGLTLSGNIEEYNDGDGMLITGDGTITIS